MKDIILKEKMEFIAKTLKTLKDILAKRKTSELKEYLLFAAEKKAEEVIEAAISLNQEILKTRFNYLSKSYYESFTDLSRLDIFLEDELKALATTAGFRNRLAHDYLELSDEITAKSMEKMLEIYPAYLKKIKTYLDSD